MGAPKIIHVEALKPLSTSDFYKVAQDVMNGTTILYGARLSRESALAIVRTINEKNEANKANRTRST